MAEERFDAITELAKLLTEARAEVYFVPPPDQQARIGCTCRWPTYPGRAELDPACRVHGREAQPRLWKARGKPEGAP